MCSPFPSQDLASILITEVVKAISHGSLIFWAVRKNCPILRGEFPVKIGTSAL